MSLARASLPPRRPAAYDVRGTRLLVDYWPVAIVTLGPNPPKDDIVGLLRAIDANVVARREPYVIITDTRGIGRPPGADVRAVIGAWMKKNAAGHTSLGSVTIVGSTLIRGALTALYWLFTPPNPQGVAGDWVEARDWAAEKLRAGNVRVPERLLAHDVEPYGV